ncbi:MAG: PaaI family thioesterase [Kofleriaceae bacterium]
MTDVPKQADLDDFARGWNQTDVLRYLGFHMAFPDQRTVEVSLPKVMGQQRGGKGTDAINGGILAALYDFALGATSLLVVPIRRSATVQLSMSFEKAVRGNSARCVARVDRSTKNLVFSAAELYDEAGTMCSRAQGVISLGAPTTLAEWRDAINGYADEVKK